MSGPTRSGAPSRQLLALARYARDCSRIVRMACSDVAAAGPSGVYRGGTAMAAGWRAKAYQAVDKLVAAAAGPDPDALVVARAWRHYADAMGAILDDQEQTCRALAATDTWRGAAVVAQHVRQAWADASSQYDASAARAAAPAGRIHPTATADRPIWPGWRGTTGPATAGPASNYPRR